MTRRHLAHLAATALLAAASTASAAPDVKPAPSPAPASTPAPAAATPNPLLGEWKTPFGLPPFAEIKEEHFLPALKEGMAAERREIDAITGSSEPPTLARRFRTLLEKGRSEDPMKLYQDFRGRPPSVQPLLKRLGFEG